MSNETLPPLPPATFSWPLQDVTGWNEFEMRAYARAAMAQQAAQLDDYATEINRLRNVIQAACTAGTDHMIERWKVLFPDAPVPSVQPTAETKDAARYRWLRDCSVPPHNFYLSVPTEFDGVRYAPAEVDAYIDAAITSA